MTCDSVDRLPYSEACERNKAPILARLQALFARSSSVLEIGSGTGQHAAWFAAGMPWLRWTCSDVPAHRSGLLARVAQATAGNIGEPLVLDVQDAWPQLEADAIFSANTAHIMPWPAVEKMFAGAGELLPVHGRFVLYGPFLYGGAPTSEGNAAFDRQLQDRGTGEGIRNVEAIQDLASIRGLRLLADCAMPANNRLLAWEKIV